MNTSYCIFNKPITTIIYSVLLTLSSLVFAVSDVKATRMVVLGDSISAAYGMDKRQGWVSLLEEKLAHENLQDYTVINASISGNTTGDGLSRLPLLLQEYQPAIVIIELGGNDGLRGYPLTIMKNNLNKMIQLTQQSGAQVLLAGMEIPPNYGQRYTDAFRQIYRQVSSHYEDVVFLPFILEGIATEASLMQSDGIHPTAAAQPMILSNVWPHLQTLLGTE